jgi:hypothetical protein
VQQSAYERERRCTAIRNDGQPCRAWAIWGAKRCSVHAGRHHRGPMRSRTRQAPRLRAAVWPCGCSAYDFVHRPGGGACSWPEGYDDPLAMLRPRRRGTARTLRMR